MLFPTTRTPCANAQHTSATADVAQTNTDNGREQGKGRRQGGEQERGDGQLVALECFDSAHLEASMSDARSAEQSVSEHEP
jgi:hypothetical protein